MKHSAATPNAHGVVLPPSSGQPGDGQFIPAFWYSPPGHRIRSVQSTKRHRPTVGPNAKHQPAIILYLHGGAYVGLTTHEADPATALIKTLTQETDLDVLAVEYRLAGIEAYPAQLQDAAAAWLHLVSPPSEGGLGIAPHRIVVLGDSAGGNLSIALVRWLGEMARSGDDALPGGKGRLGKPRAVMLLSPWCDISAALSMSWPLPDIVPAVYGDYGRSCLLRTHHPSLVYDPKVSPYYDTPEGLGDVFQDIRVYVACGGVECLRPEIEAFVKSLRQGKRAAAADEDDHSHRRRTGVGSSYLGPHRDGTAAETDGVVFDVVEDKPHDFPTIPFYGRASRTLWKRSAHICCEAVSRIDSQAGSGSGCARCCKGLNEAACKDHVVGNTTRRQTF